MRKAYMSLIQTMRLFKTSLIAKSTSPGHNGTQLFLQTAMKLFQ